MGQDDLDVGEASLLAGHDEVRGAFIGLVRNLGAARSALEGALEGRVRLSHLRDWDPEEPVRPWGG